MPEVSKHKPGMFCWIELATSDPAGAKRFYSELFDWSANDMPAGEGMTYTMLQLRGKDVAGLYQMQPEQQQAGIPPHWYTYVAVQSADEAAKKAASLGATVVMPPFDVLDVGRMAALQDPAGAHFAVWEARRHTGTSLVGEPGTHCWTELVTHDTKKAGEFYSKMFGWKPDEMRMTEPRPQTYTVFKLGEEMVGGMLAVTPEMGAIPSHWLVYFAVRGADETTDHTKRLSGKIYMPPTDIPDVGRFAVGADPQGAAFAILEPKQ